jgi:hypothetical protein
MGFNYWNLRKGFALRYGEKTNDVAYNITILWYNLFTVRAKKLLETNIELLNNRKKMLKIL